MNVIVISHIGLTTSFLFHLTSHRLYIANKTMRGRQLSSSPSSNHSPSNVLHLCIQFGMANTTDLCQELTMLLERGRRNSDSGADNTTFALLSSQLRLLTHYSTRPAYFQYLNVPTRSHARRFVLLPLRARERIFCYVKLTSGEPA